MIHLISRKSRNMKILKEVVTVCIIIDWTSEANEANCTLISKNLE